MHVSRRPKFLNKAIPLMAIAALGLAAAHPVYAQITTFDFESATATSNVNSHPGALRTLIQTSDGLTATFTRQGNAQGTAIFDVVDTPSYSSAGVSFPASWGTRSLDPFSARGNFAFIVDFSSAITSASIDYGDFGGTANGDYDTFTMQAYSGLGGTGTLLTTSTDTYGGKILPTFDTVSVSAADIRSITFIGGSPGNLPNSVYYDNLSVTTPAPEPSQTAALGMGVLGLAGLAVKARRRSAI